MQFSVHAFATLQMSIAELTKRGYWAHCYLYE
jgi:hypothetical protein